MWCFWAAKGGAGCSTVAFASAVLAARGRSTLLVDLDGDLAALAGGLVVDSGVADWMQVQDPPPDALSRLEVPIGHSLSLLPWGREQNCTQNDLDRHQKRSEILARLLAVDERLVIIDLGLFAWKRFGAERGVLQQALLGLSTRTTLVTRRCPLSMAAAQHMAAPDDVVLVGRSIRPRRIRARSKAPQKGPIAPTGPVAATVRWDASVARAVARGDIGHRMPGALRGLSRLIG